MMLWKIIEFELYYRARRPATYLYFLILFLLALLGISLSNVNIGESIGQVKQNAPTQIAQMMVILTAMPGFFITSAIMGVPVLRDYMHNSYEIIFTRPISKKVYLAGRFLGSFIVLLLIFSGILWGFILGSAMPWINSDNFLPISFSHYVQPFWIFALPNLLFSGALFFWGGVYNRSILWVFVQGIFLLALYFISGAMTGSWNSRTMAAILDPIGVNLLRVVSRYWTIAELNSQAYQLSGLIFVNRLLWLLIAGGILVITALSFHPMQLRNRWWKRSVKKMKDDKISDPLIQLPEVQAEGGPIIRFQQIVSLSGIYLREILFSVPFLAIAIVGFLNVIINSNFYNQIYGVNVYPTTSLTLELISTFSLFYIIIITFYSGELIWRERDIKLAPIVDSMPIAKVLILCSKFIGLVAVLFLLHIFFILAGICIQVLNGYYEFELSIYVKGLLIGSFSTYVLFAILAFFFQIWTPNKFIGHTAFILFFIVSLLLDSLGIEHRMYKYASGGWDLYSDMNGYGHQIKSFVSYRFYWGGVAMILAGLGIIGYEKRRKNLKLISFGIFKQKVPKTASLFMILGAALSLIMGGYIYYNTRILNRDHSKSEREKIQVAYEKRLKHIQSVPQPKIRSVNLELDLYPYKRNMKVKGRYILFNDQDQPISKIYLQLPLDYSLSIDTLYFDRVHTLEQFYKDFQHWVYKLEMPLEPGDSLQLFFSERYQTQGFKEYQVNNEIVENGTFIKNDYFPSLGYNHLLELKNNETRKEAGLPAYNGMKPREDSVGIHTNVFGDDADYIRFEILLSTTSDQIALAPGRLVQTWTRDNRNYFMYSMNRPMANFYSIVSARYQLREDTTLLKNIHSGNSIFRLEIFHHPNHAYNISRMMNGMRKSLSYYSRHFSPYQFLQLRIMEFPRYRMLAQSFANTIPLSEGLGFVIDVKSHDVDMAFYITAHEVAHQWWGHQVLEADVQGSAFLSETLAQYSALMVMKETYGEAMMQNFLKYELDLYLKGRASESRNELPLVLVENQDYIHYHKGSLAMYAFQDYVSEDSVNAALRRYCQDWKFRTDRYPTSNDLMKYFREVTPDSLSYILHDLFESITLYENRVLNPTYKQLGADLFQVTVPVNTRKYRSDNLGNELPIEIDEWIDIGVIGKTSSGTDTLLYLNKHRIDTAYNEFEIIVSSEPSQAGIDPIHKLIDRNPEDNLARVVRIK